MQVGGRLRSLDMHGFERHPQPGASGKNYSPQADPRDTTEGR